MAVTDTTFQGIATILGRVSGDRARAREGRVGDVVVAQSYLVNRPADVLYAAWRDLANLPGILTSLERVEVLDASRSRWHVRAQGVPGGTTAWDVQLTEDVPGERLAWATLPDAEVIHTGSVRFRETPRGTEMRVELRVTAPGAKGRVEVARLLGRTPEDRVKADLLAFKREIEVGEAPTVQGQPRGTCGGRARRDAK